MVFVFCSVFIAVGVLSVQKHSLLYDDRRLCFVIQDGVLLMVPFSEECGFAASTAMLFNIPSESTYKHQIDDD